jgi:hypothetical protein
MIPSHFGVTGSSAASHKAPNDSFETLVIFSMSSFAIRRAVVLGVNAVEELHDGNAAFQIRAGVGSRVVEFARDIFEDAIERDKRKFFRRALQVRLYCG